MVLVCDSCMAKARESKDNRNAEFSEIRGLLEKGFIRGGHGKIGLRHTVYKVDSGSKSIRPKCGRNSGLMEKSHPSFDDMAMTPFSETFMFWCMRR